MHRKRWIIAPLTAVMVLLGLTFGISPATAVTGSGTGQACKFDYLTYNACLNIFPTGSASSSRYQYSVIVGIDLRMPAGNAQAALRRGSSFEATMHSTAIGPGSGVNLPVRSSWPQAGHYVLSAQFGFDIMDLDRVSGDNAFQAEIVFTEVGADGSKTVHTYKTGIIH